jgi:hypothetical protein
MEVCQFKIGIAIATSADKPERVFHTMSMLLQKPQLATVEEEETARNTFVAVSQLEKRRPMCPQYR